MTIAALAMMLAPAIASAAPLTIPPQSGRVAHSETDWAQMVPMSAYPEGQDSCDSPVLNGEARSPDGKVIYQMVCRWVTSDYIVAVRVADGRRRGVIDGNSAAVLQNGPYKGYLLVERHHYRRGGGSDDPTYLVRPDGKVVMTIAHSARDGSGKAVAQWLHSHGWQAR